MTSLTDEQIVIDALGFAKDHADHELREATNLYGHYPEDGLGRKVKAAAATVEMVARAIEVIQASPIPEPLHPTPFAFDRESVRKEGLKILQRWGDPGDKYSVWDAVRDCARLAPELGEDK